MMRNLFALCLLFLQTQHGVCQYLPNDNFVPLFDAPCPYHPATIISQPSGWEIYQTTDGLWNGPRDSARCISLLPNGQWSSRLNLSEINSDEPLFIRARLESFIPFEPFLQPDVLFSTFVSAKIYPDTLPLVFGSGCPEGICSGLMVGISIPDSTGQDETIRWQTGLAQTAFDANYFGIESCFPTEYFSTQYFKEFILKLSFDSTADVSAYWLQLSTVGLWQNVFAPPGYITEVVANPGNFSNGVYTVNVDQASGGAFSYSYLMRYTAPSYPDAQHPSWVEARPEPNTSDPQTVILTVENYQTLEIQPFTGFRGALVAGSDSVRHTAILENNGGDICLNGIDLIFNGGDEYRHSGGTTSMHQAKSCMQFRKGSTFRVTQGATLHYGDRGAGMLALCASGRIVLERDATLFMDATLNLSDCGENTDGAGIRVDLLPGSRLVFTPEAWLTNRFSPAMRLEVHMLGGTLDDSALSVEEKALIRRFYPSPSPDFAENISVTPNPFGATVTLRYRAKTNEKAGLTWTNLAGQVVYQETRQVAQGDNEWSITPPIPAGMYLFTFETAEGKTTGKMAKTEE